MADPEQIPSDRPKYQRTVGFALHTDFNDRFLEYLQLHPVPKIADSIELRSYGLTQNVYAGDKYEKLMEDDPSLTSLFLIKTHIIKNFPDHIGRNFGISRADRKAAKGLAYMAGFGDVDFTWNFSSLVANEAAKMFVSEGVISAEQKTQLTLQDWADIIGTGWFSRLMHDMALTANATYGSKGRAFGHFQDGPLKHDLAILRTGDAPEQLFEYSEQNEHDDGHIYPTISLSGIARKGLRKTMKGKNGAGCPVARHTSRLPMEQIQRDPHTRRLIADGTWQVDPERSSDKYVCVTQKDSAIDKAVAFFAQQLDEYATIYGTPRVQAINSARGMAVIRHESIAPVDAFRWPAPDEV